MLEKVWDKIDKFYLILALVLALMAILIIATFRGVFSAYLAAYEISEKDVGVEVKVQKEALDEVYAWLTTKEPIPLQTKGLTLPVRDVLLPAEN